MHGQTKSSLVCLSSLKRTAWC